MQYFLKRNCKLKKNQIYFGLPVDLAIFLNFTTGKCGTASWHQPGLDLRGQINPQRHSPILDTYTGSFNALSEIPFWKNTCTTSKVVNFASFRLFFFYTCLTLFCIFSCDSSSIRDNVRRSVGPLVRWMVRQQRVSRMVVGVWNFVCTPK